MTGHRSTLYLSRLVWVAFFPKAQVVYYMSLPDVKNAPGDHEQQLFPLDSGDHEKQPSPFNAKEAFKQDEIETAFDSCSSLGVLDSERDIATHIISVHDDPNLNPWTLRAFVVGLGLSAFGGVLGKVFLLCLII